MENSQVIRKAVFVATGKKYLQEAYLATLSFNEANSIKTCLLTDQIVENSIWDEVILLKNASGSIRDKLSIINVDADEILFLDSDTYILEDLSPTFELLKRFDLVAKQDWSGRPYQLNGVPESYPEFNTGVMLFRKNDRIVNLFKVWESYFEEYKEVMGPEMDQRSFRKATFECDELKVFVLPPEYNQMNITVGAQTTKVKILHGRPFHDLLSMQSEINKKPSTSRVYIPKVGVIHSINETLVKDFFSLAFNFIRIGLKELFRRIRRH